MRDGDRETYYFPEDLSYRMQCVCAHAHVRACAHMLARLNLRLGFLS